MANLFLIRSPAAWAGLDDKHVYHSLVHKAILATAIGGHLSLLMDLSSDSQWWGQEPSKRVYNQVLEAGARYDRRAIVAFALEHGANIDHKGGEKATPLIKATLLSHRDVIELLLLHGADQWWLMHRCNTPPLCVAAAGEDRFLVTLLIRFHALREFYAKALYCAVERGQDDMVGFLLNGELELNLTKEE